MFGAPRPFNTHPEGTPELRCCVCGVRCPVDGRTLDLCGNHGRPFACLRCGYRHYGHVLAGIFEGEPGTLKEVVECGLLGNATMEWATIGISKEPLHDHDG